MSSEQTFNMIISDGWLVPFAGWKIAARINDKGQGRGDYSSARQGKLFVVIDNDVFIFDKSNSFSVIGRLDTFVGDVFIAENNAGQVGFSDGLGIYIYDSASGTPLERAAIDFTPGYLDFKNTRFLCADVKGSEWRLSEENNGLVWPFDRQHVGQFQAKADNALAAVSVPGAGNLVLVMGKTVTQLWTDVGAQIFPYQLNQAVNIDYGCINPASIAKNERIVAWVGVNEKSGPVIMYMSGDREHRISTDGIDFQLSDLKKPENCYGYMFRQDGHDFYIITWPTDNLTYAYDFNTDKFYTLCDQEMNAFIPKRIAFFNNEYYFVSIIDGNLYKLSTDFDNFDYGNGRVFEMPRVRVCRTVLAPDGEMSQSQFVAGYAGFTVEQGQFTYVSGDTDNIPRIDMRVSKDGGVSFGSDVSVIMNPQGIRQNRCMWWGLGMANDLVHQVRFWGFQRFVVTNGAVGVRL